MSGQKIQPPTIDTRIVNGQDATEGQFPYIVSVRYRGFGHFCGAFIISSRFAGTAAHCVEDLEEEDRGWVFVATGMIHVSEGVEFRVLEWFMHEDYDKLHFLDLDVGALLIDGDLLDGTNGRPIPLNAVDPPAGSVVTISGWGRLSSGGASPTILQWTDVNIVDRDECLDAYTANITIK